MSKYLTFAIFALVVCSASIFSRAQAEPRPEMVLQVGHHRWVSSLAFSPDSKVIASGGADTLVKFWDAHSGEMLRTLPGSVDAHVSTVAFSPDGRMLASGSSDVKLWDVKTGRFLKVLRNDDSWGWMNDLAFSSDGTMIASAREKMEGTGVAEIDLWDARTGKRVRSLLRSQGEGRHEAHAVAFSPDGKKVAGAFGIMTFQGHKTKNESGEVRVWNTHTGKVLRTLSWPHARASAVAFSPDGATIAVGTGRFWAEAGAAENGAKVFDPVSQVEIYDARTGQLIRTLVQQPAAIIHVAFSRDGKKLLVGDTNGRVRFVNAETGVIGRKYQTASSLNLPFAIAPDGTTVAVVAAQHVKLHDAATGNWRRTLRGREFSVTSATLSPDGATIASGNLNDSLRVWDAHTGTLRRTLSKVLWPQVWSVAFSNDGNLLAGSVNTHQSESIRLWNAHTGQALRELGQASPLAMAFSPDSTLLAADYGGTVQLWEAKTGRLRRAMSGRNEWLTALSWSPDSTLLAGGVGVGTIKIWNSRAGAVLRSLPKQNGQIGLLGFRLDNATLVVGAEDMVSLWQARTGKLLRRYKTEGPVALSPNGTLVASLVTDPNTQKTDIHLLDARTGRVLRILRGHLTSAYAVGVAFSGDSTKVVSGGMDGTVKLWDVRHGYLLATFVVLPPAVPNRLSTDWITHTADGYYHSTAGAEKFIRWRVGEKLYPATKFKSTFHRPDIVQKALAGITR